MLFTKDLNSKNTFVLSNETEKDLFTPNKSPFSHATTSLSSQDIKKDEDIGISEFPKIIKPTPNYLFPPYEVYNSFEKANFNNYNFTDFLEHIKINSKKNIKDENTPNYLGKKRKIILKELQVINNNPLNEKAQEDFNINKSAFKKVEIKNNFNTSGFDENFPHIKIKKINKKKIKKNLINKIIINESNTNNDIKENDLDNNLANQSQKIKRIFKSIKSEEKDKNGNINNKFSIIERRKRGRKPKNEIFKKRVHDAYDYDNILRKIQVHFLTFIISFINDLIGSFSSNSKDLKFKNLSYNLKKVVKHSYVETLKKSKIGDILQLKASTKNKKSKDDVNIRIYEKVCNLYPCLNHFFDMYYLDLFNQYYFKSIKVISFEGKNITLSRNTRVFSDLLTKNRKAAEKIQEVAIRNFIGNTNGDNKQTIFIIKK